MSFPKHHTLKEDLKLFKITASNLLFLELEAKQNLQPFSYPPHLTLNFIIKLEIGRKLIET